jgi:hypothetical protein
MLVLVPVVRVAVVLLFLYGKELKFKTYRGEIAYLTNSLVSQVLGRHRPKVAAKWLTLLIREVPGSNLGPETGYPDRFFVFFLSSSRQIPR